MTNSLKDLPTCRRDKTVADTSDAYQIAASRLHAGSESTFY